MLLPKSEIVRAARQWELPVFSNPCPSAGKTKRSDMLEVLDAMCGGNKVRRKNVYNGLARWQWEQNLAPGLDADALDSEEGDSEVREGGRGARSSLHLPLARGH
jgi:hypothetical protein